LLDRRDQRLAGQERAGRCRGDLGRERGGRSGELGGGDAGEGGVYEVDCVGQGQEEVFELGGYGEESGEEKVGLASSQAVWSKLLEVFVVIAGSALVNMLADE